MRAVAERPKDQYETVGVVKMALSNPRHPVAVMINRNTRTSDLSFQFGLLRRGHIDTVRYWREDALMQMAALAKVVANMSFARQLGGIEFSAETVKKLVDESPFLEWVDDFIPGGKQKKVSMTLGERAKQR